MAKIRNSNYEINNKLHLTDLIQLTEYRYFFDKLDKMPLNCDQKM